MHRLRGVWYQVILLSKRAHEQKSMPPTIAPSPPAPGRRLLILRNDSHVPATQFLTFEGLTSSPSGPMSNAKRNSLLFSPGTNGADPGRSEPPPPDTLSGGKKRWSLFRTIKPRGNEDDVAISLKENHQPGRVGGLRRIVSKESLREATPSGPRSGRNDGQETAGFASRRNPSTGIRSSFRFSLEWVDKDSNMVKGRRLYPPKLPLPAQTFLRETEPRSLEELALQQGNAEQMTGEKYLGRALSEWALVVNECQNFFDRRKSEGVSGDALVETPTLGVDWFRKTG